MSSFYGSLNFTPKRGIFSKNYNALKNGSYSQRSSRPYLGQKVSVIVNSSNDATKDCMGEETQRIDGVSIFHVLV